jgi:hypothetical protein
MAGKEIYEYRKLVLAISGNCGTDRALHGLEHGCDTALRRR